MTHAFDTHLTLHVGSHRRTLSLAELAGALGISRAKLGSVLLESSCPDPVHTPRGDGNHTEGKGLSLLEGTKNENVNENIYSPFPFRGKGGEPEGNHGGNRAERVAVYLADRLQDWKSYRFFLVIAATVPEDVVLSTLTRALDVPEQDVRRSRGAYFTAMVRRYLAAHAA